MSEPLIDPDCRDGKHGSCVGGPCQCACHGTGAGPAACPFCETRIKLPWSDVPVGDGGLTQLSVDLTPIKAHMDAAHPEQNWGSAPLTLDAPPGGYPGAVTLDGDNIVKPWRYR
jgi:hypothetical protein